MTDTETRCNCCDLPLMSCGKAAEDRERALDRQRKTALIARGFFAARFRGYCTNCHRNFDPGEPIKLNPQTLNGYIGECCEALDSLNQ